MHFICTVWGLDHWCLHFFVFPRWYPLCLTPFWLRRPSECWMIKWPSVIWEFSWWALWVSRCSPVPPTTEPSTSQPLLRTCCTHPNRWEPWEVTTRIINFTTIKYSELEEYGRKSYRQPWISYEILKREVQAVVDIGGYCKLAGVFWN